MKKSQIIDCLKSKKTQQLFELADKTRKKHCGNEVHLRGIIEFSNYCERDCVYCGLCKSNRKLYRYRLSIDEIFRVAKRAEELQCKTIVLQSGEDKYYKINDLCALIRKIKKEVDCAITLSIGERTYEEYKQLKEAGTDRYLLKFETSDEGLYRQLKPDSSYTQRLLCLRWLKELGYQVGSGNMVGLPGQTLDILAGDILLMKELELDMIGIGPFISHPDTLLKHVKGGTLEMVLKTVALARIVTRDTHIPATTAVGTIDPLGRQKALQCGANVIMPNLSPQKNREYYQIYPNKICINDQPGDCRVCIGTMVKSLGRTISGDYGHSLR